MKRLHERVSTSLSDDEERNRKVRVTPSQVIITLDQNIESKLLYYKFRIQTTELQLFLQYVPILYWYPLEVIGTINFKYNIDPCVFSAAVRNPLHQYRSKKVIDPIHQLTTKDLITKLINAPNAGCYGKTDIGVKVIESIQNFIMQEDQNLEKSKLNLLLESLLNDKLFIDQIKREIEEQSIVSERENQNHFNRIYNAWNNPDYYSQDAKRCEIMKDDEEIALQIIKYNAHAFRFISNRLQNDVPFLLKALKQSHYVLEHFSERFKDNEEIVLYAIKQDVGTLECASKRLKNSEEFILQAVKANGQVLGYYLFTNITDNELIVLEAVKQNGNSLCNASDRLQDNEKIVLEAVKQDGSALYYASDRLKNNEQIVIEAIKQNGYSIFFASDRFKDNEEVALQAVKQNGSAFISLSNRLQDIELIVLEAVKTDSLGLCYASDRLQDREEIVLEAVKHNDEALYYASKRLRNDFNFANEIFKCCNSLLIFRYIGEELRNIELIYHFIENHPSRFHELMRNNKCLII